MGRPGSSLTRSSTGAGTGHVLRLPLSFQEFPFGVKMRACASDLLISYLFSTFERYLECIRFEIIFVEIFAIIMIAHDVFRNRE